MLISEHFAAVSLNYEILLQQMLDTTDEEAMRKAIVELNKASTNLMIGFAVTDGLVTGYRALTGDDQATTH